MALVLKRVLGWEPRLNDLDTIVGHALGWEKRLIEYRAASQRRAILPLRRLKATARIGSGSLEFVGR